VSSLLKGIGESVTYLQELLVHLRTCTDCWKVGPQEQAHRLARLKLLH